MTLLCRSDYIDENRAGEGTAAPGALGPRDSGGAQRSCGPSASLEDDARRRTQMKHQIPNIF